MQGTLLLKLVGFPSPIAETSATNRGYPVQNQRNRHQSAQKARFGVCLQGAGASSDILLSELNAPFIVPASARRPR